VIVASGEEPAVVLAFGARGVRGGAGIVYVESKAAARYGASAQRQTTKSAEAYAGVPESTWAPYRDEWLPEGGSRHVTR
jgi:hypothetical protein